MNTLKNFWEEVGLLVVVIMGVILLTCASIVIPLGAVQAYYQSQVTGYTWAQCFWAGDTIQTLNLKNVKELKR